MLGEHQRYAAGAGKLLLTWRGWRLFPMVCYDLRFPVWCRNTASASYDLMLCVANWPAPRREHWSALLKARAIENLAFVAGVNRVGHDGNGLDYAGQSAIYGPRGETLVHAGDTAKLAQATLQLGDLHAWRERFPAWMDADAFQLLE
jgi:predicted amidohydrolase